MFGDVECNEKQREPRETLASRDHVVPGDSENTEHPRWDRRACKRERERERGRKRERETEREKERDSERERKRALMKAPGVT
jgi:hypothetical protein